MQSGNFRNAAMLLSLSLAGVVAFIGGCKKHVASVPPAQTIPAPTAQPTITLNASPTTVNPGASVNLTWSSTNATDVSIDPSVGRVAVEGTTPVTPTESTTYVATANGPGGTATATARVTVTGGAAVVAPSSGTPAGISELFEQNVRDAFFDFNKADIRPDARDALTKDAEFLRSYSTVHITIEGHCDERGSTEYNLGLGQRRAQASKNYLVSLGISADRIDTVSWGKERPFCTESAEECWQQNRRGHFVMAK
ncbi:MAG TPA: peptidoglycan-associated lipoprotein Pal [Candidatus Acidoferrales bacterium]|nr:peptidoglycan-associated lipoprotein Pal [Candidatus Acidoferrales bacterium]